MRGLKHLYVAALSITVGVLSLFLWQHPIAVRRAGPHAYIERGEEVQKHYDLYSQRLAKYYTALLETVTKSAPDLVVHLQSPRPIAHGYQILPVIMRDASVQTPAPTGPLAYSWPWTDNLIHNAMRETVHGETDLRHTLNLGLIERRAILERLVRNYEEQSGRLRNIDAHLQYNRLWQAAIASDRAGFDRATSLYGAVVERQSIVEALKRVAALFPISGATVSSAARFAEWITGLRNREALLTREINREMTYVDVRSFVEVEMLDHEWIFHVPLFTDIEDQTYLSAVKEIIEAIWQVKDGKNSYRVKLRVMPVSSAELYDPNDQPAAGSVIDISRHIERFPSEGAVLTTGSWTTHVEGQAIALGPHPIAPRVLAHEFGHILGFRDRYVRGYQDLGENGFEVMEVAADADDIMAGTAHGVVKSSHFLQLLAAWPRAN